MTGPDRTENGSVFWRVQTPDRGKRGAAESMIEITADGTIRREVDLDARGSPIRITRPGEAGTWDGSRGPARRPRSVEFDVAWGPLGTAMSEEEFDATYARRKPHSRRRRHGRGLSRGALLGIVLVAIVATVVTVAGLLEEILRSLFV